MTIETHYMIHADMTIYRVRPNPDGGALDGSQGVVIEWRDDDETEWKHGVFISPTAAEDVARAICLLVTGKALDQ